MSDYMFMLDSHLNADQARAVSMVREVVDQAQFTLFLTGAAMRDMMGGFPIRELDFTIEGSALKVAKSLTESGKVTLLETDELRKAAYLLFPGNIPVHLSMARDERYSKPGAKPQVQPAAIHDDLRCRDFTVNAIALSLSKASRGLLLDPTNGLGDLECKELRTISNYTLYNDPARLLRLIRLRTRLGFTIAERTLQQYRNAREAKIETRISAPALARELRQISLEIKAPEIVKAFDEEGLLTLFSPALVGAKVNMAGLMRLQKALTMAPDLDNLAADDRFALFLSVLLEKLTSRERSQLISQSGLDKSDQEAATKLDGRALRLEKEIAAAKFTRPSSSYAFLSKVPTEVLVSVMARSSQRIVLDRLKNYLSKHLPTAQEITEQQVTESGGGIPGTPAFLKVKAKLIALRLDARPKKVVLEEPPAPPPPPLQGRRSINSFGR